MERTQISLTKEQKKVLKTIATQKHAPLAEVVREAIEQYIAKQKPSAIERISKARGLWKDRKDLDALARIGLDDNIAEGAGRYMNLYRKSYGINIADAIIAASTLARGVLYTLNDRHFPMNDIKVIKPY